MERKWEEKKVREKKVKERKDNEKWGDFLVICYEWKWRENKKKGKKYICEIT